MLTDASGGDTVIRALDELSVGLVSNWSLCEITAVFSTGPRAPAVAV